MKKILIYFVIIAGCVVTLLPFCWMVSSSLKTTAEIFAVPPSLIPEDPQWENYVEVQNRIPVVRYFINSVIVTFFTTVGTLITTVLAAFAFSKVNFWGRDLIFSLFVATIMIPEEAILIPNFIAVSKLGWMNHYTGMIIPWTVSVFSIFLLRQFFLSMPEALYKSAKIDGCSDLRFIWRIMIPTAKPALITIAMLRVINSWNEFLWPLLVTNVPEMRTLPVALTTFTSEAGNQYNLLMAASTIIILPVILVYLFMRKYIVAGIVKGGLKG